MLTIQSKLQWTTDGRQMISITFERESPDSDSPVIEVIYQVEMADSSPFKETPVLIFLSATRTDTREPTALTDDERRQVLQAAANKVSEEND